MAANVTPTAPDKLNGYESPSGLHALLEATAAQLRTQTLIAAKGLLVLPEYHADLLNSMKLLLNKKLSVVLSVGFGAVDADHDSQGSMLRRIVLEIDAFENVLINQGSTGTKVSALSFAEAALAALHMWQPAATDALINPGVIRMMKAGTLIMNKDKSDLGAGMVCYTARVVTSQCLACHCAS